MEDTQISILSVQLYNWIKKIDSFDTREVKIKIEESASSKEEFIHTILVTSDKQQTWMTLGKKQKGDD